MCSTGCPFPGQHESWGECVRSKGVQLAPGLSVVSERRAWDKELGAYADARAQGVQPAGTRMPQVRAAMRAVGA
jgi:hypothetical protein